MIARRGGRDCGFVLYVCTYLYAAYRTASFLSIYLSIYNSKCHNNKLFLKPLLNFNFSNPHNIFNQKIISLSKIINNNKHKTPQILTSCKVTFVEVGMRDETVREISICQVNPWQYCYQIHAIASHSLQFQYFLFICNIILFYLPSQ